MEERNNLHICKKCLMAIESHEGTQAIMQHSVDCNDEEESKCDWCQDTGFDTSHKLI